MKNKLLLLIFSLSLVGCSSAGIDGSYQRIEQTNFEKEQGMSKGLEITENGTKLTLKNSWGDVPLYAIEKDQKLVIQYNNQDAFFMDKKGDILTLIDVDNPSQEYKFKED